MNIVKVKFNKLQLSFSNQFINKTAEHLSYYEITLVLSLIVVYGLFQGLNMIKIIFTTASYSLADY